MKFNLGEELKDKVTGFTGVVMGRTEYFTGCVHYGLASQNLTDGKPLDWQWFDEKLLERVSGGISLELDQEKNPSGSFPNPSQW